MMKKSEGCVRLYAANVSVLCDANLFATAYDSVCDERKEKINRFVFQKDKRLSLGAALLLNRAVKDFGITQIFLCSAGRHSRVSVRIVHCGRMLRDADCYSEFKRGAKVTYFAFFGNNFQVGFMMICLPLLWYGGTIKLQGVIPMQFFS